MSSLNITVFKTKTHRHRNVHTSNRTPEMKFKNRSNYATFRGETKQKLTKNRKSIASK